MLKALWFRTLRLIWYIVFRLTGRRVSSNSSFKETARITAGFLAPLDLVAQRLPSPRFRPIEFAPGKCVVTVGAFQMRRVAMVPPYNEVGVEVPVVFTADDGKQLQGAYVFWLPVTKEEGRWAGVEIYGFPKFLADIRLSDLGECLTATLREGGREVLRLEVPKLPTAPTSEDQYYLSTLGDTVLLTQMSIKGSIGRRSEGCRARLQLGDHPIADQLRAFSLDPVPVREEFSDPIGFVLHSPVVVGRLQHHETAREMSARSAS